MRILQRFRGYILLLLLSVIWGLAFVAIRKADLELSAVSLTLLRWFLASAGFLILLPLAGKAEARFEKIDLPRLLIISLANVAGYHLPLNYAEKTVSSGLAGLMISFAPVFVVLLSVFSLKEKTETRLILALVLAVLGALVLSSDDANLGSASLFGPLLVILAGFFYAVFAILSKPLVHKYGALPVTFWAGLLGTVMITPLASMGFFEEVSRLSTAGWVSVILALLSTVIAYSIFYTLVRRGAVSKLSIQLYLVPVVSVIGGVLLLGEAVTIFTITGGVALLVAVGLATRTKR